MKAYEWRTQYCAEVLINEFTNRGNPCTCMYPLQDYVGEIQARASWENVFYTETEGCIEEINQG